MGLCASHPSFGNPFLGPDGKVMTLDDWLMLGSGKLYLEGVSDEENMEFYPLKHFQIPTHSNNNKQNTTTMTRKTDDENNNFDYDEKFSYEYIFELELELRREAMHFHLMAATLLNSDSAEDARAFGAIDRGVDPIEVGGLEVWLRAAYL